MLKKSDIQTIGPYSLGIKLKNEGIRYELNDNHYLMRSLSLGSEAGFVFQISDNRSLSTLLGLDYNFHYKEKFNSDIIVSEWISKRVPIFSPYFRVGFGGGFIRIFGEYYFMNFINSNFKKKINGKEVKPYEHLKITRFNAGLSFNFNDSGISSDPRDLLIEVLIVGIFFGLFQP